MKPRTKMEHRAVQASKYLPDLTEAQRDWAIDNCFNNEAYCRGQQAWCGVCGGLFPAPYHDECVCPECGRHLKVVFSKRLKVNERSMLTVITTCVGLQVVRTWEYRRQVRKGNEASHKFNEITRVFLDSSGSVAVMACNRAPFSYYNDVYIPGTMSVKRADGYKYAFECLVYPRRRVIPDLRRNGYRPLQKCSNWLLMQQLLINPRAETLIKSGQDELLARMVNSSWDASREWHSVKIAIRHGYKVTDASLWIDMLHMMEQLGIDTHNPRYVCPADLKGAHDAARARLKKKHEEERAARRREIVAEYEGKYREDKGRYLGLMITDGKITIRPLQSVADFVAEGEAMHHCVFDNGYYKRADTLILSARDNDDKRIETIEINLETFKVLQSRGVCNGITQKHDAILGLINSNMNTIMKLAKT